MRWLFVSGVSGVGVGGKAGYARGFSVVVAIAGVHDVYGGGFGILGHGGGSPFSGTWSVEPDRSKLPFPEHEVCSDGGGLIGNVGTGGKIK